MTGSLADREEGPEQLRQVAAIIAGWAQDEPLIARAYLFGSRAKGVDLPGSDLDVAIELDPGRLSANDETEGMTTWFAHKGLWQKVLKERTRQPVHLAWHHPEKTEAVHRGLVEAGYCIYRKGQRR